MRFIPLLLAIAACGTLDHIPPALRSQDGEAASTVFVYSTCSEEAPFKDPSNVFDPHKFDPDIHWAPDRIATGVAVSEAHVVTAAHAVSCAVIPLAMVVLPSGDRFPAIVQRDDLDYGAGDDVARLRVIGAYDRFGLGLSPPRIRSPQVGEVACAEHFRRAERCGEVLSADPLELEFASVPGDSGSPIYGLDGALLGIVVRVLDDGNTVAELARQDWLEGT